MRNLLKYPCSTALFICFLFSNVTTVWAKKPISISILGGVKYFTTTQSGKWSNDQPFSSDILFNQDAGIIGVDLRMPLKQKMSIVSGLNATSFNSRYQFHFNDREKYFSREYFSKVFVGQIPILFSIKASKRWDFMIGPCLNYIYADKDVLVSSDYVSVDSVYTSSNYGTKYKHKLGSRLQFRCSYAVSKWSALSLMVNQDILSTQNIQFRSEVNDGLSYKKNYNFDINQKFLSVALIYQVYLKGEIFSRSKRKPKPATDVQ